MWFRVSSIIGGEGFIVETATWKLIVYDVDVGSLPGHMHDHAETPDEKAMRSPKAYSTMLGAYGKNTAILQEKMERSILLWKSMCVFQRKHEMEKETWN